ncbi:hypothetical protein L596_013174 [Steinernema carpocapsae]|uniref:Uncharacterized protein n=1 Tax=Steinernema carpocapsae TaxID=34508 RepID=A0A4U5NZV7_STECR|nr:hypothetical protein L596_013174 [Steinernema carpocapsae]
MDDVPHVFIESVLSDVSTIYPVTQLNPSSPWTYHAKLFSQNLKHYQFCLKISRTALQCCFGFFPIGTVVTSHTLSWREFVTTDKRYAKVNSIIVKTDLYPDKIDEMRWKDLQFEQVETVTRIALSRFSVAGPSKLVISEDPRDLPNYKLLKKLTYKTLTQKLFFNDLVLSHKGSKSEKFLKSQGNYGLNLEKLTLYGPWPQSTQDNLNKIVKLPNFSRLEAEDRNIQCVAKFAVIDELVKEWMADDSFVFIDDLDNNLPSYYKREFYRELYIKLHVKPPKIVNLLICKITLINYVLKIKVRKTGKM